MKRVAIALALAILPIKAEAKHHRYGLICGLTQRIYFGLKDASLNLALEWARKFPHSSAQPGAVVVQRRRGHDTAGHPGGHVSRIVSLIDSCHATVTDEKGTYQRDICKNLVAYVVPR